MHGGFAELRRNLPLDISRRWPLGGRLTAAGPDIARVTAIWRDCRERFGNRAANGGGDFLFGGFCIADAMFAPVAMRFVTYGVPMDPVSAAYVETITGWPPMRDWCAAAREEPWIIRSDVNDGPP
jgi:glutathione S-transferase